MAQRVIDDVKLFFSNDLRHEFEKVAGQGGSGIALCFRDKQAGPDEFSRFIIKTVLLGDRKEIANETKWLRRLQWAEHIVTPLKLDPDPLTIPRREGGRSIFFGRSYFFIEYLENGTLDALLFKRRAAGLGRLPNRILWSIFLCLARACVAMAYPPFRIRNRRGPKHKSRELLPSPFYDPGNLVHTDMNLGNLMFGEIGEPPPEEPPLVAEHHLVPIVKLIDFGDAMEVKTPEIIPARRTYDEELRLEEIMEDDVNKLENIGKSPKDGRELFRNVATDLNILEIGVVMGRLVTNDLTNPRAGVLRELMVELRDNLLAAVNPSLDYDIFWLVARCLACSPDLRPPLSQLVELVEYYSSTKRYGPVFEESDVAIYDLIQRWIFDADVGDSMDTAIVLSPDSFAADVSMMSLDSSAFDESMGSIGGSAANPIVLGGGKSFQGSANHPIHLD